MVVTTWTPCIWRTTWLFNSVKYFFLKKMCFKIIIPTAPCARKFLLIFHSNVIHLLLLLSISLSPAVTINKPTYILTLITINYLIYYCCIRLRGSLRNTHTQMFSVPSVFSFWGAPPVRSLSSNYMLMSHCISSYNYSNNTALILGSCHKSWIRVRCHC